MIAWLLPASCAHNDEYACAECAGEAHRSQHPTIREGCLTCKLASVQISPAVKTTRSTAPPASSLNSWEKGIATDHRGLPLLGDDYQPIPLKRYAEQRSRFEARRHVLESHPDPFGGTTKEKG